MDQGQANPPESAPEAEAQLRTLIGENRFLDAMALATSARSAFPADPTLAGLTAYLCLRLGRGEQAIANAVEALALGADDPMTMLVLGLAYRSRGRHAEAADILLHAHRRFPDQTNIAGMLIEEMSEAHGVEATRPVFDEVFAQLPDREVAQIWSKALFAADVDDGMPPGSVSAPVMTIAAWLEKAGLAPAWIGEREIMRVENPPVFGDPSEARARIDAEGYIPYAATLRDATIFSHSSLILMPDGAVLNDTIADEQWGQFLDLPHDKTVIGRRGQRLLLDVGQYPVAQIEAAVMLSGWVSEHFGHWIPEYLCRLSYLEQHPRFADLAIVVDAGMPPQHLEFLSLLVPNRIVQLPAGGALKVGELIVASPACFFPTHLTANHTVPPQNQGGLPIGGFRYLQRRVTERLPPPAVHDRKLYLARKASAWRKLVNEEEVIAALTARGFEIQLPETMTIEEQVRMYQGAALVVAPNGSSLLNAVFAPKDLKLLVLSQRGMFNWGTFYGLMRELDYDLTFFCSAQEIDQKHADYSIDVPNLLAAIDSL